MSNFVKYKDVIYIHCFGVNDQYNLSSNQGRFSSNGLKLNSKVFRFNLCSDLYSLKLSKHAKLQILQLVAPAYYDSTVTNDYSLLRIRTSTECKTWDSFRKSIGYPIIYKNTTNKNPETFTPSIESYISIGSNFLSNGYIEFEIEHPNEGSNDIDFTQSRNNAFYIYFKIVDVETETTQDNNLAPQNINDSVVRNGHNIGNDIPKLRDRIYINIHVFIS
jgi:hypothetical protein